MTATTKLSTMTQAQLAEWMARTWASYPGNSSESFLQIASILHPLLQPVRVPVPTDDATVERLGGVYHVGRGYAVSDFKGDLSTARGIRAVLAEINSLPARVPSETKPKPPSDADIAAMQGDGKPGDSRCGNDPPATHESAVIAGLRGQVENITDRLNTAVTNGERIRSELLARIGAIDAYLQQATTTSSDRPLGTVLEVNGKKPTGKRATGKAKTSTPPPRGARKGRR